MSDSAPFLVIARGRGWRASVWVQRIRPGAYAVLDGPGGHEVDYVTPGLDTPAALREALLELVQAAADEIHDERMERVHDHDDYAFLGHASRG